MLQTLKNIDDTLQELKKKKINEFESWYERKEGVGKE